MDADGGTPSDFVEIRSAKRNLRTSKACNNRLGRKSELGIVGCLATGRQLQSLTRLALVSPWRCISFRCARTCLIRRADKESGSSVVELLRPGKRVTPCFG